MRILTIFGAAVRSLQRSPLRSTLTALGIIVGVAAVVTTTSIGSGAKAKIQQTLSKPESRTIYLGAIALPSATTRIIGKLSPADSLHAADYYAIRNAVENISAASPRIYLPSARAQASGRTAETTLEGVDVEGFTTLTRRLLEGALFSSLDVKHAAAVCVISESLARTLYPGDPRPGRIMRISGTSFTVIGIVDDVPNLNSTFVRGADLHVYVPFTSLLRRLDSTAQINISVQARDIEHVNLVEQDIRDVMEQRRSGRKAEFRTTNAFESIKIYAEGSLTVARLLAAVGAISMVVGGIGIMNIMLVSVTERTREIGVRMAVGSHCRYIHGQFLTEAIALSLLGGGIGIAIGWAMSWLITRLNGWPTTITVLSVVSAFLCSLAVGVFFGYHPARQAASLSPVQALRSEH